MNIISLGWGIQSFALAAMSAMGILPRVDFAVHADTTHERNSTYEFAKKWTPWLEARGVKIITVSGQRNDAIADKWGGVFIPAFTTYAYDVPFIKLEYPPTRNPSDAEKDKRKRKKELRAFPKRWRIDTPIMKLPEPDLFNLQYPMSINGDVKIAPNDFYVDDGGPPIGIHLEGERSGMLRRQCTGDWKLLPMRRWISKELKRRGLTKTEGVVNLWLGITLDEIGRVKKSDVKYIKNTYPLLDFFDTPWTREQLIDWLETNGFDIPPKSACVFCPFHDRELWREIKSSDDWSYALEIDSAIRHKRAGYNCYLLSARQPLETYDFEEKDTGQMGLWEDAECEGVCFL